MTIVKSSPHGKLNYNHVDRREVIDRIVKRLKPLSDDFDAIVVCGASMMLISSVVAYKMNKNLILVRKINDDNYSGYMVEGLHHQRYIFIDDLISSGKTLKYVLGAVNKFMNGCECVYLGLYLTSLTCGGLSWVKQIIDVPVISLE